MRPDGSAPHAKCILFEVFASARDGHFPAARRAPSLLPHHTAGAAPLTSSRAADTVTGQPLQQPKQITMDKAYGATADETNPFSKAELGEAQDLKPVLAPVFVQPLRSRAKRRRRSGGLLLAAVLAVVVTASKLAQHGPRAQLERVAKAVAPASAARASNRGRSPVRPEAADTEAPASAERAANRGRSPVRPSVEEDDQARRNLRIFLNERMGGAKTQRDGVAPHHRHGEHKIGFGLMAHSRSRRRAMQHLKHLKSAHHSSSFSA